MSRYIQELEILESNNISSSSILMKNLIMNEAVGGTGAESVASAGGEQKAGSDKTSTALVPASTNPPVQADESAVSSMSDLSTTSKKNVKRWNISMTLDASGYQNDGSVADSSGTGTSIKHIRAQCLLCCRSVISNKITKCAGNFSQEVVSGAKSTTLSQKNPQDVSFNSPESILSDESNVNNIQERVTNLIMKNVEKMGNPAYHKHGKQVLLELKQKYPRVYQDICLYSEVSKLLSQSTYRMICRRFIQEIFFDMSYDPIYEDLETVVFVIHDRLHDEKLMTLFFRLLEQAVIESRPLQIAQQPAAHKLHASLKSPQLASVYETSVENLVEKSSMDVPDFSSTPNKNTIITKAQVEVRPASSRTDEKTHNRHSSIDLNDLNKNSSMRRRRFNTLELDLSCTKNKFPLTHRTKDFSPTGSVGFNTSTFSSYSSFIRNKQSNATTPTTTAATKFPSNKDDEISIMSNLSSNNSSVINLNLNNASGSTLNTNNSNANRRRTSSGADTTDIIMHDVTSSQSTITTKSLSTVTSPTSPPPFGRLYCEERLLKSSKSEATLTNNKNVKK